MLFVLLVSNTDEACVVRITIHITKQQYLFVRPILFAELIDLLA